jgi:hypothetical protein
MQPLRIRLSRIVDCETIVSLVGIDSESNQAVTVHIVHRSYSFWEAWREAGFPQPIAYQADRLVLRLDMVPDEGAETGETASVVDLTAARRGAAEESRHD